MECFLPQLEDQILGEPWRLKSWCDRLMPFLIPIPTLEQELEKEVEQEVDWVEEVVTDYRTESSE